MTTKKYHEMVKYICARVQDGSTLSKTKLFKIMFFCDFTAYRELGESISGDNYIRMPYGPVPTHGNKELKNMIKKDQLAVSHTLYRGKQGEKYVTTQEVDLSGFSPYEISIIDSQLEYFKDMSAGSLSDLSHQFIGWQVIENGKNIPYGTALLQEDAGEDFEFPKEYINKAFAQAKTSFAKMNQ
ncbi:SocA family protein [bacterium]|nr:SocA family protein [bacterium]